MALTSPEQSLPGLGPVGPGGPRPPGWLPGAPTARGQARPAAQIVVYLACMIAVSLPAMVADATEVLLPIAVALGAGIGLCVGTRAGEFMTKVSGLIMSVAAMLLTAIVLALVTAAAHVQVPPLTIVLVGALVLGLDWRLVGRLRGVTFAGGLLVVPMVGLGRGWAYPAALLWLVVAIVALWLLQADERAGLQRPLPAGYGPDDEPHARGADLLGTLGIALAVGIAVAFLLGQPSCSLNPNANPPDILSGRDLPNGLPGGGTGGRGLPEDYQPGGKTGGDVQLSVDENGDRFTTDPLTGERYGVTDEGGTLVARDSSGRVVAEIDESGVTASDAGGRSQRYQVGEDGRYYVEGADGERLVLDTEGGQTVLRDGDGNVVAGGRPNDDHLVIRDPNGDVVVPDPDGDGQIPIPNGGVRDALPGLDGQTTYESNGDSTTASGSDGTTRTYDRDPQGRRRVTVKTPGHEPRTFVYEDGQGGDLEAILEYDQDGNLLRRYRFDAEGVIVDGRPSGTGGSGVLDDPAGSGGAVGDPAVTPDGSDPLAGDPPAADEKGGRAVWPWILGGVATLAAAALAAWFWSRRPDGPPDLAWAEELVTRIEAHGAAHGRARKHDETILAYTAALHDGPIPDDRITWLGALLSAALFGPTDPPPETRHDAERTMDELMEAHPTPTRSERRRQHDSEDKTPASIG